MPASPHALVMVAMLFLLKERLALQAEAPMLSLADLDDGYQSAATHDRSQRQIVLPASFMNDTDEDRTPWLLASGGSRKYDKVELS